MTQLVLTVLNVLIVGTTNIYIDSAFFLHFCSTSSTPVLPQDDYLWVFLRNRGVPEELFRKCSRIMSVTGNFFNYISLNFNFMYPYILDYHMWFQRLKSFHIRDITITQISLYKSKESLSVCVSVCLWLCVRLI